MSTTRASQVGWRDMPILAAIFSYIDAPSDFRNLALVNTRTAQMAKLTSLSFRRFIGTWYIYYSHTDTDTCIFARSNIRDALLASIDLRPRCWRIETRLVFLDYSSDDAFRPTVWDLNDCIYKYSHSDVFREKTRHISNDPRECHSDGESPEFIDHDLDPYQLYYYFDPEDNEDCESAEGRLEHP